MRDADRQQALGREIEVIEAGSVRRAAFAQRHVLGDPEHAGLLVRRQPQHEPRRGGEVRLTRRRDFVQRAARQAAAERGVDARDAERQGAWIAADPGGLLQGLQTLAKLVEHETQAFEETALFGRFNGRNLDNVPYLF